MLLKQFYNEKLAHASYLVGCQASGEALVVDVRAETEWAEGHLPGARHIMLGYLPQKAAEVIDGQTLLVQCRTGARSAIGASILQAQGAASVINLAGGIRDWAAAALPIAK